MMSKTLIALCVLVAVASAIPAQPAGGWGPPSAGGANPWIPPWISAAAWYPQWVPCTTIGSTCVDCSTKVVCTKIGGLQKACTDPTMPHCNAGECSATPSAECGPAQPAPAGSA